MCTESSTATTSKMSNQTNSNQKEQENGTTTPRSSSKSNTTKSDAPVIRKRRGKRDKKPLSLTEKSTISTTTTLLSSSTTTTASSAAAAAVVVVVKKQQSKALQKHGNDSPRGGIESLLPSAIGVLILICGVMAKMGFRGRATVAGIDLGTTNSVICVQAPAKGVGQIDCIPDLTSSSNKNNNSPIIPSVVSFLEPSERKIGPSSKVPSLLDPHPSAVVVGAIAKRRIDSHPHHTLYNAKRILGRPADDPAVHELRKEVEFGIYSGISNSSSSTDNDNDGTDADNNNNNNDATGGGGGGGDGVYFTVPDSDHPISPVQVGAYVVNHLKNMADAFLGHDNVRSAVICVPAKFNSYQRQLTAQAFQLAGIKVARVVEEPTAAALAYGLHRKEGVDYILVYDFGGGTLDISLLYVTDGFVDVMGSDGDDRLGGTDFDYAIAHFLLQQRNGQQIVDQVLEAVHQLEETIQPKRKNSDLDLEEMLAAKCPALKETPLCTVSSFHTIGEQLKIELSNKYDPDSNPTVSSQCLGLATDTPTVSSRSLDDFCAALQPFPLSISASEYEQAAQPLFDRSIIPITRLLKSLDLSVAEIDEIVMVGGTTRMPQIRNLVKTAMQVEQLNTHIDPDITVAYGAASVID